MQGRGRGHLAAGERVGTLLVVSNDTAKTREVKQYLVDLSKGLWSSAPLHGARIVGQVLRVQYARELWLNQVRVSAPPVFHPTPRPCS